MVRTLVDLWRERAQKDGDRVGYAMLSDSGDPVGQITYADLDRQARQIATSLGRVRGERVLLLYPPGLDYLAAFAGCVYAGAIAVPLYPPRSSKLGRLLSVANDARPTVVLTLSPWLALVETLGAAISARVMATDLAAEDGPDDPADVRPDDIAFLQYTSGSTGDPKGVCVTHANLLSNMEMMRARTGVGPKDHVLSWLPPYHDMGLIGCLLTPSLSGSRSTIFSPQAFLASPITWLRAIDRLRVTASGGPNFAYALCARRISEADRSSLDLSSWEVAFCGAEPVREETLRRFEERFRGSGFRPDAWFPCYGLAEGTLFVSGPQRGAGAKVSSFSRSSLEEQQPRLAVSRLDGTQTSFVACGFPADGLEVQITSRLGEPTSGIGEIWVSGPSVAAGYFGRPDLSEEIFRAGGRWLRTGDLGFFSQGELFIAGRIKDLIIIAGRNIAPQDVERVAEGAHQGLRPGRGAAFGIEVDGEEKLVLVYEYEGQDAYESVAVAVRGSVAAELDARVHALALVPRGTIEVTSSGKIMRSTCRQRWLEGSLPLLWSGAEDIDATEPSAAASSLHSRLAAWLGISEDRLDPRAPLDAAGIDSLFALELCARIEAELGKTISPSILLSSPSLQQIEAALEETREPPVAERHPAQISPIQEGMWFLERLRPGDPAQHVGVDLHFRGPVDPDALRVAFDTLVDRHALLAMAMPERDGRPTLVPGVRPSLDAGGECSMALPFDVQRGPLLRASLVAPDRLRVVAHHLIVDGGSLRAALADLAGALRGRQRPPDRDAYFAWAQRQADLLTKNGEMERKRWRERLEGAAAPRWARPAEVRTGMTSQPVDVPREVADALRAACRSAGATLFAGLSAALAIVASRHSRSGRVTFATPVARRTSERSRHAVGPLLDLGVIQQDLTAAVSVRAAIQGAMRASLDAIETILPFHEIVAVARSAGIDGLDRLVLDLQPSPPQVDFGALTADVYELQPPSPASEVAVVLREQADGSLRGEIRADNRSVEDETAARLARHLLLVLSAMARDIEQPIAEISLLSPGEGERALRLGEGPQAALAHDDTLHGRFERLARAEPLAAAAWTGDRLLSRAEVDARANGLAAMLVGWGLSPGDRVAVSFDRDTDLAIAVLGLLKAGLVWVPIDPDWPASRRALVLRDSGAKALVTHSPASERLGVSALPVVLISDLSETSAPPERERSASAPAYAIYTSGSTGEPKGVLCSHRGVLNLLDDIDARAPIAPGMRCAVVASFTFDVSVWELFASLCSGGVLCVAPEEARYDGERLVAWIRESKVESTYIPAQHLEALEAAGGAGLKRLLVGVEPIVLSRLGRIARSGVRVVNGYGPTEASVAVTLWDVPEDAVGTEPAPIGRPIRGARALLLDEGMQPTPLGLPGELWLGGEALAVGYLGDLNGQRFVSSPFAPGDRLYRTGDLARIRSDGELCFVGRVDGQLKVRGVRVEPGEIESVLLGVEGTREVVAGVEEQRLVAWVVSSASDSALLSRCRERLPAALVPQLVRLGSLPRLPGGKIDRRSLVCAPQRFEGPAPSGPNEHLCAELFAEVLGLSDLPSADSDFFALGGHSLLAVRLNARLVEILGVELPLRAIFRSPTPRSLAAEISASRAEPVRPLPRLPPGSSAAPLSFAQRRIALLHAIEADRGTWNIPGALLIGGPVDESLLQSSLDDVIARHASLRTVFVSEQGQIVQRVLDPLVVPIEHITARDLAHAKDEAERRAALPFDLERGPLLRACLVRIDGGQYLLAVSVHHIVCDGWSLGVWWRDWMGAYRARSQGLPPAFPSLQASYLDYASWESRREIDPASLRWWRAQLADAPAPPEMPADGEPTGRAARVWVALDAEETARLDAMCRELRVSRFMVLLAATAALLGRHAAREDVVVGVPVVRRPFAELQDVVGLFLDTLPLRVSLLGAPTLAQLALRCREALLAAEAHREVPYERIVSELGRSGSPLYDAVVNVWSAPLLSASEGLDATPQPIAPPPPRVGFALYAEGTRSLSLSLVVPEGRVSQARAQSTLDQLVTLLRSLPSRLPVAQISLVTPASRAFLPDPSAPIDAVAAPSVPIALLQRGREAPSLPAWREGGQDRSMGELLDRARGFARWLARQGARPGEVVALIGERSFETAAGIIGTWLAGGVIAPIDAALPPARRDLLAEVTSASRAVYARELPCVSGQEDLPEPPRSGPAYLICTSGTSGKPKAVLGTHEGLAHFVSWQVAAFGLGAEDRASHLTGLSFDVVLREIFSPLVAGAVVVVPEDPRALDGATVLPFLARERITVVHTVPTLAGAWLGAHGGSAGDIRVTFFAGEPLAGALVERWRSRMGGRVVNLYGPTETTLAKCAWEVREVLPGIQSVGRPLPGAQALVLGPAGLCGVGEIGEIGIRTPFASLGYPSDPEAWSTRFVRNPIGDGDGLRIYLTGDLGRYRPDGTLEIVGRKDDQVKIGGVRVEPAEIAATISALVGVQAAAVVAAKGARGQTILVAHVAPHLDAEGLEGALRARLPSAMVPAAFVFYDSLPLTPNGKVDRGALREPSLARVERTAPRSEIESALCALWSEVLGVEVGVHDSFFRLGGDSLLAMELASKIRLRLGLDVPLRALFEAPTVAAVAACARVATDEPVASPEPEPSADRSLPFPLTDTQQAYWLGREQTSALGARATQSYQELSLPHLDLERLEWAIQALVARHDALRIVIRTDGTQQVLEQVPAYKIAEVETETRDDQAALRAEMIRARDLGRWPLFDFRVSRSERGTLLHVAFDAIVVDAWSGMRLARELNALYHSPRAALPPLPLTLREVSLARREREGDRAWWLDRLVSLPPPPDLDVQVPPGQHDGEFVRREYTIDLERWRVLERAAANKGLTPSVVLLTVYCDVLATWARHPRFTLNLTVRPPARLPGSERVLGNFSSLLLLEVHQDLTLSFLERARRLQQRLLEDLEHGSVGGVELLRELGRRGQRTAMPYVFTSTLGFARASSSEDGLVDEPLPKPVYGITQGALVWINHGVSLGADGLELRWDTLDEILGAARVEAMFQAECRALSSLVEDPSLIEVDGRSLVSSPESESLYTRVNATELSPPEGLLHTRWLEQAERDPSAIAVITPSRSLSYGELRARACQIAQLLVEAGTSVGELVAILMEKGWEQVASVLGVSMAGAAWLPISADLPEARQRWLIERGGVRRVLCVEALAARLPWLLEIEGVAVTNVDRLSPNGAVVLPDRQRADGLAYVIYTSGSTGEPKGVAIDIRGALGTIEDIDERFEITERDRVLGLSSLSFDLSVWDIFGPLSRGAALVLPEPGASRDPSRWIDLIDEHRVTVWNSVPALLEILVEHATQADPAETKRLYSLRLALLSGDWIGLSLPDRARRLIPGLRLASLGGATEASIWSVVYPIDEIDPSWRSIPYGKPLGNQTIHVLGESLQPKPIGAVGELWIGGTGVAMGYHRDPERTEARFVRHPTLGRLYRTGDLGRWRADGNVEILGREDLQVKLGGYRIELGEIEATMLAVPGVSAAIAAVVGEGSARRLMAWFVAPDVRPESIAEHLAQRLPGYMIPANLVPIDKVPLSSNGKVDRKALPMPGRAEKPSVAEPASPAEEELLSIWRAVLGRADIALDDDLFALGGDSIQGIQILAAARRAGLHISATDLFTNPTVRRLAPLVRAGEVAAHPSALSSPLGPIQRWFFSKRFAEPHHWNQAVRIDAELLDTDALREALRALISRHETLRARFSSADAEAEMRFAPSSEDVPLWVVGEIDPIAADLQGSLDLERGPVLRVAVDPRGMLIVIHHLVVDGISWRILLEDLASAYNEARSGSSVTLPQPTASFAAHVAALRQSLPDLESEARVWLEMPWARARPLRSSPENTVENAIRRQIILEGRAADSLLEGRPDEKLIVTLLCALSDWQGEPVVAVDIESHGRDIERSGLDTSRTCGWFTSLFPAAIAVPERRAEREAEVLRQLRLIPRRGLPFSAVRWLSEGPLQRSLAEIPSPGVSFDWLGRMTDSSGAWRRSERPAGPTRALRSHRRDVIEIIGVAIGERVELSITCDPQLADTIGELLLAWESDLRA